MFWDLFHFSSEPFPSPLLSMRCPSAYFCCLSSREKCLHFCCCCVFNFSLWLHCNQSAAAALPCQNSSSSKSHLISSSLLLLMTTIAAWWLSSLLAAAAAAALFAVLFSTWNQHIHWCWAIVCCVCNLWTLIIVQFAAGAIKMAICPALADKDRSHCHCLRARNSADSCSWRHWWTSFGAHYQQQHQQQKVAPALSACAGLGPRFSGQFNSAVPSAAKLMDAFNWALQLRQIDTNHNDNAAALTRQPASTTVICRPLGHCALWLQCDCCCCSSASSYR